MSNSGSIGKVLLGREDRGRARNDAQRVPMDGLHVPEILERRVGHLRWDAHQRAMGHDRRPLHFRRRQHHIDNGRPRHQRIAARHGDLLRRTQRRHRLPGLVLRQRRGRHRLDPAAPGRAIVR